MKQESRDWFDEAYKLSRIYTGALYKNKDIAMNFPFSILKKEYSDNMIRVIFKADFDDIQIRLIQKCLMNFRNNLPPKDDFLEEKQIVLEELIPELQKKFCFVRTAISFGSVVGDIDIGFLYDCGFIRDKYSSSFKELLENPEIINKFPLVDWVSICYYRMRNIKEFIPLIFNSLGITSYRKVDNEVRVYLKDIILNTQLLWGDQEELDKLRVSVNNSKRIFMPRAA